MGKLWVEVCLISAQGLRSSSLFKLQWFAVGWIDPNDKYCTRIDASGTVNPVWKTRFSTGIDVSEGLQDLALQVEVYSREPIFLRESLHGKATIALKELLGKCGGKSGVSRPVEESGSFPLRTINGSRKTAQGFVHVSIRVSAEREEPGLSNRGIGKRVDFAEAGKDGLFVLSPNRVHLPVTPYSEQPGICTRKAMETLSQNPGSEQPRKFVLIPRHADKTLYEDPESNQNQKIILNSRHAMEVPHEDPKSNQSPKIILTRRRQAVETFYEDPGSSQPQKTILNPRREVETLPENPRSNRSPKTISTRREVMETLPEDLRSNQPRKIVPSGRQEVKTLPEDQKIIMDPRHVVKSLSEDPKNNQSQKIKLTSRQAIQTLYENPGSNRTQNSLSAPRPTSETWSEEQGSNQAMENPPNSKTDNGEAKYYQPWRSLTPPPPPPPPSNVGYIPTFLPKANNNHYPPIGPGFSAEALSLAAIIFGDDFLTGFHFCGGLENPDVVPTDHPYCISPVNRFQL